VRGRAVAAEQVRDEGAVDVGERGGLVPSVVAAVAAAIARVSVGFGDGGRGPVTEEIQSRFFDVVNRRTDDYDEWFEYVEE